MIGSNVTTMLSWGSELCLVEEFARGGCVTKWATLPSFCFNTEATSARCLKVASGDTADTIGGRSH